MIKVAYFPMSEADPASFYRMSGVLNYINHPELSFKNVLGLQKYDWSTFVDCQVLLLQRPHTEAHMAIMLLAKDMGLKIISDWDDDLLNVAVHKNDSIAPPELRKNVKRCLSLCDEVWVTTPTLKSVYKPFNKNIHVLYNAHNDTLFPVDKRMPFTQRKLMTYRGGASHIEDVQQDINDLVKMIKGNKDWEFRFVGAGLEKEGGGYKSQFELLENMTLKDTNHTYTLASTPIQFFKLYHTMNAPLAFFPLITNQFNKSKCLVGGTKVITPTGMQLIKDVKKGDKVWQEDRYVAVGEVYKYENQPTTRITTKNGFEITGTPHHKLRSEGKFVAIKDMITGDKIDISFYENKINKYVTIPIAGWVSAGIKTRNTVYSFNSEMLPKVTITPRWGRLIGYIVGDGTLTSNCRVGISCDTQYPDVIADIEKLAEELSLNLTYAHKKYKDRASKGVDIYFNSALLRYFFAEIIGFHGSRGKVLKVPACIWESPKKVVKEFLKGCFETDGTVNEGGCSFTTKQLSLAQDIQVLLLQFKIKSRLGVYFNPKYKRNYFSITLARQASDAFYREIGFISALKQQRLRKRVGKKHSNAYFEWEMADEIKSIQEYGSEDVYDLNIPEGNYYMANGIVSHNSNISLLEATYAGSAFLGNRQLPEFDHPFVTDISAGVYEPFTEIRENYAKMLRMNDQAWEWIKENRLLSNINNLRIERLLS